LPTSGARHIKDDFTLHERNQTDTLLFLDSVGPNNVSDHFNFTKADVFCFKEHTRKKETKDGVVQKT
jgi:hypothetical protein